MTGGDNSIAKMCVKCKRIVPKDSTVCPECGGTVFETVDLIGGE